MTISDEQLADALIERLNSLIEDPMVRDDVSKLIETRVECSNVTLSHPRIQAQQEEGKAACLGFLGVLNGAVGVIGTGGRLSGWGYIAAVFGDDGKLQRFRRTDSAPAAT